MKSVFAQLELFAQVHPIGNVGAVDLLGQRQQFLHFTLDLGLQLDDVSVRARAVA